ncbi:max-binding protein MNT isoform X2 [Dunckerocampus dactyliophorus]|uniref:max-binding protein MNT isoform X2 n=1 Tax=Dunckerocampus dactyliophorus TaxID=161453 RepID=UPI002405FCA3|nr:max-binding protein MNT isoform X2 [Dunckerocampus dactyliophorus]
MSIETLLEAAKFLELQAQQQRAEDELKEKLRLDQLTEQRHIHLNNYTSMGYINNVFKAEVLSSEHPPAPMPPSLPPPSMPVAVIPIPLVTPNPADSPALPVAMLSHPAAPPVASPKREPPSPQEQSVAAPRSPQSKSDDLNHKQPRENHQNHPSQILPHASNTNVQQQTLQEYSGSIVTPPQQPAVTPQALQPAALANSPTSRGGSPDDGRLLDLKKRPGGAGTREVHNKLEKNRRAHLKECFETLKKNIPNIDEKKTSNLSVLRSALRYIQTLKRKEKEYEHDMERLAREKIATQQQLEELKNELNQWMDVVEIDRVLRQTVQPEEDQASTSTASEGEDAMDDEDEDDDIPMRPQSTSPSVPEVHKAELHKMPTPTQTLTQTTPAPSFISQHISIQHKAPLQPPCQLTPTPQPPSKPVALPISTACSAASTPTPAPIPAQPSIHPTVIAHASVSHPSVIQAVNHVIQTAGPKHIAHLAPTAPTNSVQLAPGQPPISHITVHPVAHLGRHLPTLYPQPVAVTQPALISHIAHTLGHVNGTAAGQPTTIVGKQTMVAHHPQLVGQTVLNPVTMVTMPSFPISTLKLA